MKFDGPGGYHEGQPDSDDEKPPPTKISGKKSIYCPYRAWLLSRGWNDIPEEHFYCGKKSCWQKHFNDKFLGMELKVMILNVHMKIV